MDTASQWPQDIVEAIATCPKPCSVERKVRPHKEQALNCPRCNSSNTKFCYYNNYSLSQPRYFCKTCRRYWTEGGSLRNIPVGGGSRKNNRSPSSSYSSNSSSKKLPDLVPPQPQNPKNNYTQDLNLGFSIHNHHHADLKAITEMIQVPNFENNLSAFSGGIRIREREIEQRPSTLELQNPNSSLELLTTGLSTASRGLNNYAFMPLPVVTSGAADFGSGFPNFPEFKLSSLNFSLHDHGLGSNYGSFQGVHETNGNNNNKLLFPFEDLKQDHSSNTNNRDHQNGDSGAAGYWNGVIGGGSW